MVNPCLFPNPGIRPTEGCAIQKKPGELAIHAAWTGGHHGDVGYGVVGCPGMGCGTWCVPGWVPVVWVRGCLYSGESLQNGSRGVSTVGNHCRLGSRGCLHSGNHCRLGSGGVSTVGITAEWVRRCLHSGNHCRIGCRGVSTVGITAELAVEGVHTRNQGEVGKT